MADGMCKCEIENFHLKHSVAIGIHSMCVSMRMSRAPLPMGECCCADCPRVWPSWPWYCQWSNLFLAYHCCAISNSLQFPHKAFSWSRQSSRRCWSSRESPRFFSKIIGVWSCLKSSFAFRAKLTSVFCLFLRQLNTEIPSCDLSQLTFSFCIIIVALIFLRCKKVSEIFVICSTYTQH